MVKQYSSNCAGTIENHLPAAIRRFIINEVKSWLRESAVVFQWHDRTLIFTNHKYTSYMLSIQFWSSYIHEIKIQLFAA